MKGLELGAWLLALSPVLLVVALCFVRFSIVLGFLRQAVGAGALPPVALSAIVALVFALVVAAPVAERALEEAQPALAKGDSIEAARLAAGPVARFLEERTPATERALFLDVARRLRPSDRQASVDEHSLQVLAPAMIAAELKAAFQMGFFLLLPFLLIELVVGMVLAAAGLGRLAPEAVALPLKLLLFLAIDGWQLLFRGLLLGGQ